MSGKNGEEKKLLRILMLGVRGNPSNSILSSSPEIVRYGRCTVRVKEGGKINGKTSKVDLFFSFFPFSLSPLSYLHHNKASVSPQLHTTQKKSSQN